ncbi:hypothetical protein BCR43DRAFT_490606 [Syncephalastrum racemosum]|uniref:Uncharacterized protein n=1 Tax=Syncephalastrum racemosum TaxID=13706 RepID=A0A1X2HG52_SYNRA|nr:hypothetical protein BCR43DRAFT_490606 [Syncephalastrum racemosum]
MPTHPTKGSDRPIATPVTGSPFVTTSNGNKPLQELQRVFAARRRQSTMTNGVAPERCRLSYGHLRSSLSRLMKTPFFISLSGCFQARAASVLNMVFRDCSAAKYTYMHIADDGLAPTYPAIEQLQGFQDAVSELLDCVLGGQNVRPITFEKLCSHSELYMSFTFVYRRHPGQGRGRDDES